jgi:ATP-dependent helicase IRC3
MDAQNALPAGQAAGQGTNAREGAPSLRFYQTDASTAVCDAFLDKGQNRLLVKKPTGTGKTVWFASLLKQPRLAAWLETFPKGERKMLVIAHREELLFQARAKICAANPGLIVDIEQGDLHANRYSEVVIASIQTLSARKFTRLHRLLQHHRFRLVIVDEAHHAAAASYRTALVHLGFLPGNDESNQEEIEAVDYDDIAVMQKALQGWDDIAPKDQLLIGVTATPNRTDAIGLGCVFQTIAYSYALKQAIDDQWLVPIVPWVIESTVNLDDVRITAGEFNQKDLAAAVNLEVRNKLAVAGWRAHADGLSTLAFTVDVAHAHALAAEFSRQGVAAEALSGETPKEDRRHMLTRFTDGTLDVICNCMVLTEGVDLPRTGCILHAKPTKSATLYEQMTGRGLRIHPGKTECIVIDVVDVARRHSLQTAPVLYGLPPGLLADGHALTDLERDLEAFRERYPQVDLDALLKNGRLTLEQLRARASTFDIWKVEPLGAFGLGRALDWLRVGLETFRLSYPWAEGHETIEVARDLLGKWDVALTLRPSREHGGPVRQRTLAAGVETAQQAAGHAEAFVLQERRSVTRLAATDAPWKRNPASDKQLARLRQMGVPHTVAGLTMGQASQLITLAIARKGRR